MGKKKKDSLDRFADKIEAQGVRLKLLIDKFYPDGVRVEFASVPLVTEYIMSLPTLQRVSEHKEISEKFTKICEDSYETVYGSVNITFGGYYNFHGYSCIGFNTCIMIKATPDGTPFYLKDELQPRDTRPEFLVDSENKEAYLVLDNDGAFNWKGDSFIKLSEFHAILYRSNLETDNGLCFTISFSQEERKYSFERIYDSNITLIENLLMSDVSSDDEGELTACMDSQPQATTEMPEQLSSESYGNESLPTIPNSGNIEGLPPPNNDVPSPVKKRGRPAKIKPKDDENNLTQSETE